MHNAMVGLFSLSGGEIVLIFGLVLVMATVVMGCVLCAVWLLTSHRNSPRPVPPIAPQSSTPPPPSRACPKCGTPLPTGAPQGLCPRCVLGVGLATRTEAPGAEAGPEGTQRVAPPPEPAPPLEEIARQFPQLEILECLGRGGMGVVYKARQPLLNRFVALKILAPEKERDPRFAERFTREAQSLARLNHPNIVTVYDFGETNGLYYLLMEFVDGMSLRQLLQTRKLAPEEALTIVPPICEALQYAHQLGIVHRDIKPENILLDQQGRVKIADYGIAKLVGADGRTEPLTGEQQVIGTPHYMAPEQVERPSIVDHRADIFSLGVVFYEMLTGQLPLGKFAPPSRMVKMDVRLDEVVLHALEQEPELRYQQASQVKTDVETIARTEPGSAQSEPGRSGPTPDVVAASGMEHIWRQVKGPGTGLVVTALLNWVAIILIFLVSVAVAGRGEFFSHRLATVEIMLVFSGLLLSGIMLVAGLKLKRLEAYGLAIAGAILAILLTPMNLIGLPIGIWALVVLSRREVREAFGKGLPMPRPGPGLTGGGGAAWKVTAMIVAAMLLVLAIPVGAVLLAIGLPAFQRARAHANRVNAQIRQEGAWLSLRGRVTDAVTGQPIAGARVADSPEGLAHEPQETSTDVGGQYQLHTWPEHHKLAASAPGYEAKLIDLLKATTVGPGPSMQMDFQLQPAEAGEPVASGPEMQALDETVKRGSEALASGDYSEAVNLLVHAALKGHPLAQHRLGVMYVFGQGVPQNYATATRWFRKAAAQGQGESQFSLGLRYLLGQSVAQDDTEAARWFKLAADQGVGMAASMLAELYAKGRGVPQDLVEAYKWLAVAGDQIEPSHVSVTLNDLEDKLTPDQLAEAQRRVKEFVPTRTGPADP